MSVTNFDLLRNTTGYVRDLDVVTNAITNAGLYLHLQTGQPIELCKQFVKDQIAPEGPHPLNPIPIKVLIRDKNQDRTKAIITLDKILARVVNTQSVLAPNMVVYDSAVKNPSCTANYADIKMEQRKVVKSKSFKALMAGNTHLTGIYSNEEGNIKLLTNSLSGAHASAYNPHYNKSAHSSLTSMSRVATSYSNASCEKFITGNRHYFTVDIVIENILTICTNTDYEALQAIVDRYNLYIPSVDDCINVIERSVYFYFKASLQNTSIPNLIAKLSPLQRTAFVYTGDFYYLRVFNETLVKTFITELIAVPAANLIYNPEEVIASADKDTIALIGILCANNLQGNSVEEMRNNSEQDYLVYANTILNVNTVLINYRPLLVTLMATDNLPGSIFNYPVSIRRCVVGSDTDSTMFTCQSWVEWYFGKLIFTIEARKVATIIAFLSSHVIAHILALACKNIGVTDKDLFRLKMKNEYSFLLYLRANRAKHYATLIASREGNVFKVPKIEIKGVALKDSKIPKSIMQGLENEIKLVMNNILADKGVTIHSLMQRIANLEHEINNSLTIGETKYLSFINISDITAYKKPMSTPYLYHDLWTKVFAQKYGNIDEPPYPAIKVSVTLSSKRAINRYVQSLDPVTQDLFNQWLIVNPKKSFAMFVLPRQIFETGVAEDFTRIIDKRHIISELTAGHYILLEICGMYFKNTKNTTMLYDDMPYLPEQGIPGTLIEGV